MEYRLNVEISESEVTNCFINSWLGSKSTAIVATTQCYGNLIINILRKLIGCSCSPHSGLENEEY